MSNWVPHFDSRPDWLADMAQNNTYDSQLTLYAVASLFNLNIQIILSRGAGAGHVFHPTLSVPVTTLYLGHFSEFHGEHYITLNAPTHNENNGN